MSMSIKCIYPCMTAHNNMHDHEMVNEVDHM